jgi:hypothetical protein
MKKFTKYLFLATALTACAPLQAMQEEEKPVFKDLVLKGDSQGPLLTVLIFLTPRELAKIMPACKIIKKVIETIYSNGLGLGIKYFHKYELDKKFPNQKFPALQVYIMLKDNHSSRLTKKTIEDFDGAIELAYNVNNPRTLDVIGKKLKKKFKTQINSDFLTDIAKYEEGEDTSLKEDTALLKKTNRYLIINPEISDDEIARIIEVFKNKFKYWVNLKVIFENGLLNLAKLLLEKGGENLKSKLTNEKIISEIHNAAWKGQFAIIRFVCKELKDVISDKEFEAIYWSAFEGKHHKICDYMKKNVEACKNIR